MTFWKWRGNEMAKWAYMLRSGRKRSSLTFSSLKLLWPKCTLAVGSFSHIEALILSSFLSETTQTDALPQEEKICCTVAEDNKHSARLCALYRYVHFQPPEGPFLFCFMLAKSSLAPKLKCVYLWWGVLYLSKLWASETEIVKRWAQMSLVPFWLIF